jgi:hypothetical protein
MYHLGSAAAKGATGTSSNYPASSPDLPRCVAIGEGRGLAGRRAWLSSSGRATARGQSTLADAGTSTESHA